MTSGDPEQSDRGAIGTPSSLLPIAKRMETDPQGLRELRLGKADETAQGSDIGTALDFPAHETLSHPRGDGPRQLLIRELGQFIHHFRLAFQPRNICISRLVAQRALIIRSHSSDNST